MDENRYSDVINFVKKKRKKGVGLDELMAMADKDAMFESHIEFDDWPSDSQEKWVDIVTYVGDEEARIRMIQETTTSGMIVGDKLINNLGVPDDEFSCWQLYRGKLKRNGFSNVDIIENECKNILNNLSTNTEPDSPIKGMVVGYVQSGKTANMAGLISMAADHGWNLFIILSGTIENLRLQTRDRLYNDVQNENSKHVWQRINHLSPNVKEAEFVDPKCKSLNVCLKNPSRLRKLLNWLNSDPEKKSKLKILLIDDEADQASINTSRANEKRKTINSLIVKIVNCLDIDGKPASPYGAMNYISYTATPYANFLSEGSDESLYPKDFVLLLKPSPEYFGPFVVYGDDKGHPGLNIIDTSENVDVVSKEYVEDPTKPIPNGLKDAVAWFITSVCAMRHQGYVKPISMLVHTTQYVEGHRIMADAVLECLRDHEGLVERCRRVYERKTSEFTKKDLFEQFPEYGIDPSGIKNYPDYSEISEAVKELIGMDPEHIGLCDENTIRYKRSIHLCIDNNRGDDLELNDSMEEKSISRIIYPTPKNDPGYATAFIVIGGNTLSRGLTIQGLVSTYFGRPSQSGDTLMQMGRWFGYRRGYELMPRIWMSKESLESFNMVVEVDESLRDFIRENYDKYDPRSLPPMVRKFPKTGHLRNMTSSSKSRGAVNTAYDFQGCIIQTRAFDKDSSILAHNHEVTSEFLNLFHGRFEDSEINTSKVVRGVPTDTVCNELIKKLIYNNRQSNFKELDELVSWIKKRNLKDWNIVIPSLKRPTFGTWSPCDELLLNKVTRKAKFVDDDVFIISMLPSQQDMYADAKIRDFKGDEKALREFMSQVENTTMMRIRTSFGLEDTPLLMIYCISKDQGDGPPMSSRDIIGIVVRLPGVKAEHNLATYMQLPPETPN